MLGVHMYLCTLWINSVPAPPLSSPFGQSSDAPKVGALIVVM